MLARLFRRDVVAQQEGAPRLVSKHAPDLLHHCQREAHAVFRRAIPFIGALVEQRRKGARQSWPPEKLGP